MGEKACMCALIASSLKAERKRERDREKGEGNRIYLASLMHESGINNELIGPMNGSSFCVNSIAHMLLTHENVVDKFI